MTKFNSEQASNIFDGEFVELEEVARETRALIEPVFLEVLSACVTCIQTGGKILFFGNGGSASQAQHIATELAIRYKTDRKAIAAIALTADGVMITAAGNDLGFDKIFARQIEAIGQKGDIAFGVTTSGRSQNVLLAMQTARSMGLTTIAMTGRGGGEVIKLADFSLCAASDTTARIQEMHLLLGHILCVGIERALELV